LPGASRPRRARTSRGWTSKRRIIAALKAAGALLRRETYAHKYPYDWRTKRPTIFRATEQWFASVDGFKADALDAIRGVRWMPAAGERRISAMTSGRCDAAAAAGAARPLRSRGPCMQRAVPMLCSTAQRAPTPG
jgi:isoleucyl-tRNA synthetase